MDHSATLRNEAISEIITMTKDRFLFFYNDLYVQTKAVNTDASYILRDFQMALKHVSKWTVEDLTRESQKFNTDRICVLMDRLYTQSSAVFDDHENAQLMLKWKNIMFQTYLEVARELWRKPYLIYDRVNVSTYQSNQALLEKLITNHLKNLLRKETESVLLQPPRKDKNDASSILNESDDESDDEDRPEPDQKCELTEQDDSASLSKFEMSKEEHKYDFFTDEDESPEFESESEHSLNLLNDCSKPAQKDSPHKSHQHSTRALMSKYYNLDAQARMALLMKRRAKQKRA